MTALNGEPLRRIYVENKSDKAAGKAGAGMTPDMQGRHARQGLGAGCSAVQPGPMCRRSGDNRAASLLHGQAERRRSVSSGVSSMTAQ